MSSIPRAKKILLIGDPYLAVIAAAAGIDYYVYSGDCDRILNLLVEKSSDYGLVIALRRIMDECSNLRDFLGEHREILLIIVDSPSEIAKIDPRKHYEEFMTRYIGLKFEIK